MLYLDSADATAISRLWKAGVFSGVTTNPKILRSAGIPSSAVPELVSTLRDLEVGTIFVQVFGSSFDEMLASAREIQRIDKGIVIKIPSVAAGFQLASLLISEGASVLLTMVYDATQALLAREIGAWGIAPYFGRMADLGIDYRANADFMVRILEGTPTRILAASLRSTEMVAELGALGIRDFTLSIPIADQLLTNRHSMDALFEFERIRI